jgi:hypothetical protein
MLPVSHNSDSELTIFHLNHRKKKANNEMLPGHECSNLMDIAY